jgi:hypothetical protein
MNEADQLTLRLFAVLGIVDDVFDQSDGVHGEFQQLVTLFAVILGQNFACGSNLMSEIGAWEGLEGKLAFFAEV